MNQPEGQERLHDLVDIAIQSSSKTIVNKHPDGTITYDQIIDDDTMWFKTLSVFSNKFSRFALFLKEWERYGNRAKYNMCIERAMQWQEEVKEIGLSFRRAIDAKSSESQRDEHNSQSTYIDKIARNKVEKVYSTKDGKRKGGIVDALLARDKERDFDEDD